LILRKHILLLVTSLLLFSFSKAGTPLQNFNMRPPVQVADTTIKKDSLDQINDSKQGFKDLFVASAFGNSINTKELNPEAISFVQDYIDKYGKSMEAMKSWGKPYFDLMDGILAQHGLPKELKYLAVIESYLQSNVRSWAGAVGPWQLMPATARNFGLRVSQYYDERTDYFKSTHAACRYLTDLFAVYGDWLLVIAAYNGGPGNVNYAIKKSGSRDFWALQDFLPVESKNHVKKFIATHYIMEGTGGVTTSTKEEAKEQVVSVDTREELIEPKMQVINGRYNSSVIARFIAMDIAAFNKLNPNFDKLIADNDGRYELRLPDAKMDIFLAKKYDILYESMMLLLNQANNSSR
jgi:membrane-bound lytic murein transglycosylase D